MKEIIIINIISLIVNSIVPGKYNKSREIGIIFSIITLYLILGQILLYNNNNNEYQNRIEILGYPFGLDGISIGLIGLMGIIEPILIILVKGENKEGLERKRIINYIIIVKTLIIILFSTLDILIFFITFELILIPMFLLITRYGSKYKYFLPRLEAGIRFFMYTLMGSIFMLIGIIIFYKKFGTTSNELLNIKISTLLRESYNNSLIIVIIWIFFFFSFLIKIPMFPFHTWLPLAHSDAPTIGSIILAALLLKLASFGIIRYSLNIYSGMVGEFLESNIYEICKHIIFVLAIISIIYCSILSIRGLYDLKKLIAYSSIIHMNFSIFGFFSKSLIGLIGSSFLIFTHAFISSALFLLVGILYKRFHSRFIYYFQGLSSAMPLFSFFFLFFSFANISLPFCASFLSEFFILISTIHYNPFISFILAISLIFSSSFVIWFANRILFGSFSNINFSQGLQDISLNEFITLTPFLFITLFFTFFPQSLISLFTLPCLILI